MAQSIFSYNLSRPYPFRWFTWVGVIGGVSTFAFLSCLNFAAMGYDLQIIYTNEPNQTFNSPAWIQTWPFVLMQQVSSSCQARDIVIGTQFVTNQSTLVYKLDSVEHFGGPLSDMLPSSFQYKHNVLQNCSVAQIQIEMYNNDRAIFAEQKGFSEWGPRSSAIMSCFVDTLQGTLRLNVSTQYDRFPTRARTGVPTNFRALDPKAKASLWWGAALTSAYWVRISQNANGPKTDNMTRARIMLQPSEKGNISKTSFFNAEASFIWTQLDSRLATRPYPKNATNRSYTMADLMKDNPQPQVWTLIDQYSKSLYSTILADLGQANGPNILLPAETDLLQSYSTYFTKLKELNSTGPVVVLATDDYKEITRQNLTGPLSIEPSIITGQYLCQIPVQKPWGPLFISILVADIALAQLLWNALNLIMTWWTERIDPQAMYCTACVERHKSEDVKRPIPKISLPQQQPPALHYTEITKGYTNPTRPSANTSGHEHNSKSMVHRVPISAPITHAVASVPPRPVGNGPAQHSFNPNTRA